MTEKRFEHSVGNIVVGRTQALVLGYAGVAILYAVTRLLLVWRFPVHQDEATFATWTLDGFENPGPALFEPFANGQRPLLEWFGVALMHLGLQPVAAVRMVSFAAGALTLAVVATFATRIYGAGVGLLAGALYTILPFTLLYNILGLGDPLVTFFIAAAMLLQFELARRPRLDLALLLGLAFAGCLLTKVTGLTALYLLPASAIVFDWRRPGLARRLGGWIGWLAVSLLIAWIASHVVWLSEFGDDFSRRMASLEGSTTGAPAAGSRIAANWRTYRGQLDVYVTLPLILAAAVGGAFLLRRRTRVGIFVAIWLVVPLAGLVRAAPVPYGRWLFIITPPLVVVTAGGIATVGQWLQSLPTVSRRRGLTAALALVILVPAVVFDARLLVHPTRTQLAAQDDFDYITGPSAGTAWKSVAADLRRRADGDAIVVGTGPGCCGWLPLLVRRDSTIALVRDDDVDAPAALFAIENGYPLPSRSQELSWRLVATHPRPRNGTSVHIYQSGVLHGLTFAASPDELRAAIGGADSDYDAYLKAHPAVREWVNSWYAARAGR